MIDLGPAAALPASVTLNHPSDSVEGFPIIEVATIDDGERTFETISYYFMGLASEPEWIAHLEKLKRHDAAHSTHR